MIVRRYLPEDFDQISLWALDGYGAKYESHQFPETGFIVDGVAAYFLYKTDSSICFLENMIANKKADRHERGLALDLIIAAILNEARILGFKVAYATTAIPTVVFRAVLNGASAKPKQTLLTKILTDPSMDGQGA